MAGKVEEEEEEEAATPIHHPSHPHPLFPDYSGDLSYHTTCNLCGVDFFHDKGYSCTTCGFYAHKLCSEAPPLIPRHPLHPLHPLSLSHGRPSFRCNACHQTRDCLSSFGCDECGFFLDVLCGMFVLPNSEVSEEEQISIPVHDHPLTLLSKTLEVHHNYNCTPCGYLISREEDGYMCLHPLCKFRIHKRCIQDLYFEDGSRVPRVYHQHELSTFSATPILECGNCGSNVSTGDYFGCEKCRLFYHRDCVKFTEKVLYPPHPDHDALVLFIFPRDNRVTCQSCGFSVEEKLCYRCTVCDFALHARCGLQTLLYIDEGRAVEIKRSWHGHPLLLCHRDVIGWDLCSCCGTTISGPAYKCNEENCWILLHQGCTEQLSEIHHPHHPGHPLILRPKCVYPFPSCNACCEKTFKLSFWCEICRFYLHVGCASRLPTLKHYLHEHDLIRFEGIPSLKCNRCGMRTDSPLLRCVPCDFNLHEKCMELPGVVKHKTHHHSLTLRDFFMEDDTGEYYCDLCEKRRDGRLGVYMCLQCKMERPWVFHIECILPELRGVNVKKVRDSILKESADEVAKKEEELRESEKKVEEIKRELEELRKRHAELSLLNAQGEEFIDNM